MSIARALRESSTGTERLLAAVATLAGLIAWAVLLRADLVLTHYDAKAHLVVARRVFDNITPGWQQIGAVWLPLPHLIQLLPVQIDFFYRTGASGSLVSVACFGITAYAAARLVIILTGSRLGAAASTAILALNPNLLYLYATPMTEPLLLAVSTLLVLWLVEWVRTDRDQVPARLGWLLFAAAWTRYEAWAVLGFALAATVYAAWRRGAPLSSVLRRGWNLAIWPAIAVILFLINSRVTVGSWFVSEGFYVPDPTYQHRLVQTLLSIWWGTHQLSGYGIAIVALVGAMLLAGRALVRPADGVLAIPLALFAAAALPLAAFYQGHPYRIRYMIPVVVSYAVFGGITAGLARRAAPLVALVLVGSALIESPPWDRQASMVLEAQWDRPASAGRRAVSACLSRGYRGEKILASMGSLAHYMQELSWEGFSIADFLNEGNGAIWKEALDTGPAAHVGWMLVEERAEGGDLLAQRIRRDPSFTRGMKRTCEGGGVALYRRERVN